jgi:tRNA pseudouridine13 synthase
VNLPYLTAELPGTGGALRTTDDDFLVDEEPAYAPSGTGDHVFIRIEKRGMTTPFAAGAIARAFDIPQRDIGIAGMKDRHAVTRQWLSLPPPITPEAALAMSIDGIRILEAVRHGHKLRTGHVRANKFRIRIRGVGADAADRARAILARLAEPPGAPNWYGEQRFGHDGDNAQRGRELVSGERRVGRDRRHDRLMVSALQSELFNAWLRLRMADGLYRRVLTGDVLHRRARETVTGAMFTCADAAADEARLVAGEIALTGPMFGDRMRTPPPGTPAAEREAHVLAAAGLEPGAFAKVRAIAEGTRRDATVEVTGVTVAAANDETIDVEFTLPGGAYATAVLREVMKTLPVRVDDTPQDA